MTFLLIQSGQLAQRRHDPLARPAFSAVTLYQPPILVGLTVNFAPIASQKHAPIMQARQMLRNGVFSTTSLIALLPESLYSENGLAKHRKITFKNRQLTNLG